MISAVGLNNYATHDQSRYPELWRGCVGAWAPCLGPTGGRLFDFSRFSNWGTLTNMDNATDWVVSNGQYALDFDGGNDVVTFSNPSISFGSSASFTIWLRLRDQTPSLQANTGLIKTGAGSSTHYPWIDGLFYSNIFRTSRVDAITLSSSVDRTQWHLLSVTTNTEQYIVRQNSIVVANVAAQAVAFDKTLFSIGQDVIYYLNGQLDDVRIYNRALSETEIRLLATRRGIAYEPARRRRIPQAVADGFNAGRLRRQSLIGSGVY